jgi:hypothetical protein
MGENLEAAAGVMSAIGGGVLWMLFGMTYCSEWSQLGCSKETTIVGTSPLFGSSTGAAIAALMLAALLFGLSTLFTRSRSATG